MDLVASKYEDIMNDIATSGITEKAVEFLKVSSTDFEYASKIYGLILPVGLILVILFFLLDLMEKSTGEHFTAQQVIKLVVKLVIAEILVQNGDKIVVVFCNLSNALITQINDIPISAKGLYDTMPADDAASFILLILNLIIALFPWIVSMILNVMIILICFTRKLELVLRSALLPIGLADTISGGMNSRGIRYLRKIIAVLIQGVFMVAAVKVSYGLLNGNTNLTEAFEFLPLSIAYCAQSFITFSIMKGAKDFANDLVA